MDLQKLFNRQIPPLPWSEGDNIPWNDPDFSKRMLGEHLSQESDLASRRFEIIDKHVAWIHLDILPEKSSKILDLCCGPGLYLHSLSKLGHECAGIDYSPASIEYAIHEALDIEFEQADVRTAEYGDGYDLVMMIFGEFNVFKPSDAKLILDKSYNALNPSGVILFELHTFDAIKNLGHNAPSWYSTKKGLFSDNPHLCLIEGFWDADSRAATLRFLIINDKTTSTYAVSYQAYTDEEYIDLFTNSGFVNCRLLDTDQPEYRFLVAEKE